MKAVHFTRNNIIERLGGEDRFDFLVSTYCENIRDDDSLDRFFGNFDLNTLVYLQKEFLLVSFLEPYEETEPRRKRVMFRNDMMGIDGSIFPLLKEHFVTALHDCSIRGRDFQLCYAYFSDLRALFKDKSNHSKYRENIVERMGGESAFEFLIFSYCERLEDDERLRCYFKDLSSRNVTLLQKELILMAFLHPNANNDFEALGQRVTSTFRDLFALGMNEEHFEILESHFSAAVHECLSEPVVTESCLRLFANLITFFEVHALLSNWEYGEYGEYDEDSDESETDFDEEHCLCSDSENQDSSLSQIPHPDEASSYGTRRIQDTISQSSPQSESASHNMPLHSSETRLPKPGCVSCYVSKRIQGAEDVSIHSRIHKNEAGVSYVSKRILDAVNRSDDSKRLDESERTEDTLSLTSEDSKVAIQPPLVIRPMTIHPKQSCRGRPKLSFSWKDSSLRPNGIAAGVQ